MTQNNSTSKMTAEVAALKDKMKKKILKEVRESHDWASYQKRFLVEEMDVLNQAERDSFEKKQKMWEKLCEEGEDEGWLDWTNEYPGSHLYSVNVDSMRHSTRIRTVKESDYEYKTRIKRLDYEIAQDAEALFKSRW